MRNKKESAYCSDSPVNTGRKIGLDAAEDKVPLGEKKRRALRAEIDRALKLAFHAANITSGLLGETTPWKTSQEPKSVSS